MQPIHFPTLALGAVLLAACQDKQAIPTSAAQPPEKLSSEVTAQVVDAPNYEMTRALPDPYTYRTATASVKAGAPIRDAFGNSLGTVNSTNPKEFHVFERIPVTISGSNTYLYWMRGAHTGESVSGFISQGYIVDPGTLAGKIDIRVANGNGESRPITTIGNFRMQSISTAMGYPGPSDGVCRQYKWYGIRGTYPSGTPYAYLVWSLPNVRGGGLNRSIISDGEAFRYTDTRIIRTEAYRYVPGSSCGESVGWVNWRYVRVYQNGKFFYGWAVSGSYFMDEGVIKDHMDG
jgi:hypothetical protein